MTNPGAIAGPRVSETERLRRWRLVLGGGDADGTGTELGVSRESNVDRSGNEGEPTQVASARTEALAQRTFVELPTTWNSAESESIELLFIQRAKLSGCSSSFLFTTSKDSSYLPRSLKI